MKLDKIIIRWYNEGDSKSQIAKLIYNTDPYIYPAAFGSIDEIKNNLEVMIGQKGSLFESGHIVVAEYKKKIVGVVLVIHNGDSVNITISKNDLAESFDVVYENYFEHIHEFTHNDRVYISCLCVDYSMRRMGIGDAIMEFVIKNNIGKVLTLSVIIDNTAAINLYKKHEFKQVGPISKGFNCFGMAPDCIKMERTEIRGE